MRGNIYLVGPMGAGKSTIGKLLAEQTGRRFLDSDDEIIERTGVEIDLIFELEGEDGFRQRESKMIEELTAMDNIVLATGGGVVLESDNRERLKSRGKVIYLQAAAGQLLERTARDKKRPLLQTDDRLGKINEILKIREPLYDEIADLVINTDGKTVKRVVKIIKEYLEENA